MPFDFNTTNMNFSINLNSAEEMSGCADHYNALDNHHNISGGHVTANFIRDFWVFYVDADGLCQDSTFLLNFVHLDHNKWGLEATVYDVADLANHQDSLVFSDTLYFDDEGLLLNSDTAMTTAHIEWSGLETEASEILFDYSQITQIADCYVVNYVSDLAQEELELEFLSDNSDIVDLV